MRIFATSDLHGHLDEFERAVEATPCDLVVVAGDLANQDLRYLKKAMETWNRFCAFCGRHPERTFLFVPGNHDRLTDMGVLRGGAVKSDGCQSRDRDDSGGSIPVCPYLPRRLL